MKFIFTLVLASMMANQAFALTADKGQVTLDKLDDYSLCQKHDYSGDWCDDALKRWVEAHPQDAFKAGKMTRLHMNAWGAVPFFAKAFDAKKGDCKDGDVKLAIVDGLSQSADSRGEIVAASKKIAFELCGDDLPKAVAAEASPDSALFKNSCKELLAKNLISGLKAKKCKN